MLDRKISVAPMMDYTDRHARYFLRLIAPHILLYTEMVTAHAIQYGNAEHLLQFDKYESPVALQLGGSDPNALAHSAKLGAEFGYAEINLNVGCPSDRVKKGRFGACLMAEPILVAECMSAMRGAVNIPVTVKCRIGIDNQDSYAELCHFIETIAKVDCNVFIVHARKAWLQGLSPKQNREIPPLKYEIVNQLKQDFPHLTIIMNGGIKTCDEVAKHLENVDGVMIGREAYHNPYLLAELEHQFYKQALPRRPDIIAAYLPYVEQELAKGIKLASITRHILGLFHKQPKANAWRRYISENAHKKGAGIEVVQTALQQLNL